MKKDIKPKNELVTRAILHQALLPLKKADAKLREEMHSMEYRINNRMDGKFLQVDQRFNRIEKRFDQIDEVLRKHLDTVMGLADRVIVKFNKFEVESTSILYNYKHLEGRVKKVEEVVFPNEGTL